MRPLRWPELVSGVAGVAVGLIQLLHMVFDPIYSFASSTGQHGQVSLSRLVQTGDAPSDTIGSLGVLTLLLLLALLSSIAHSLTRHVLWKRLLWVAAVLLVLYSLLSIGTIGGLLLPAAALVLLAALVSLGTPTSAAG